MSEALHRRATSARAKYQASELERFLDWFDGIEYQDLGHEEARPMIVSAIAFLKDLGGSDVR